MRLGRTARPSLPIVALVVVALAVAACTPGAPGVPGGPGRPGGGAAGGGGHGGTVTDPVPVGPVGHEGRWLVDATGRVLLLRGINFVMKGAPYDPAAAGFDEDDVAWLKENGFDAVRPPTGDNLSTDQIAAIVRPHPVAVSGTPTSFTYHAATRVVEFAWDAARPAGGRFPPRAVTSVSLPALSYPDGYTVDVTGARMTSEPCATTLTLTREPRAASASIRVTPGGVCPAT